MTLQESGPLPLLSLTRVSSQLVVTGRHVSAMDPQSLKALVGRYHRDSGLQEGALQEALDDSDHGTAFREWLQLHVGPDNLLSKDELALYDRWPALMYSRISRHLADSLPQILLAR